MDPDLIATQEKDIFNFPLSNDMSILDEHNANMTQISLPAYHAISTNQSQNQQPIIMTTEPVFLLASIVPSMYHNQLQPIFVNSTPIQAIQLPIAAVPNISQLIGSPPDEIKSKFNLTPEIPDQIFTLPFLQLKTSESKDIQDQDMATSNLEQLTKFNTFQELAKRSHYSKKAPLSIVIPEELPPKSLFPSYSTPSGGVVLKQITCPATQSSTTRDVCPGSSNVMLREIPHIDLNAQTNSYGDSCSSSVPINQAVSQPSLNIISVPSGSNTNNQIQPTIQAQTTVPSLLQYQPFIQNQNACLQYSDPDESIYRQANQFHPTMNTSGTLQLQNINPPLYQHGTQTPLESCPTYSSIVSESCSKNTVSTVNQQYRNIIPTQVSTVNPCSLYLAQNPGLFQGIGNHVYAYTSHLN